jgi:hypothetical protein
VWPPYSIASVLKILEKEITPCPLYCIATVAGNKGNLSNGKKSSNYSSATQVEQASTKGLLEAGLD